jgi:cadmium resistance protein CadD (predicted permease)
LSGRAVRLTTIEDIVVPALLFGQTSDHGGALRAAAGQYLGFAAIRAAAAASALGAA